MSKTRLFLYSGLVVLTLSIGAFVTAASDYENIKVKTADTYEKVSLFDEILSDKDVFLRRKYCAVVMSEPRNYQELVYCYDLSRQVDF